MLFVNFLLSWQFILAYIRFSDYEWDVGDEARCFQFRAVNRAQSQLKPIWGSLMGSIFLDSPYESIYKALKIIGCLEKKQAK